MLRLVPVFKCDAGRDFAEAGNSEQQSDETREKANKPELTMNRLIERCPGKTLHAQFRHPRFRENNSTPRFSDVVPGRIIVVLN